jgi:hypothetical protein
MITSARLRKEEMRTGKAARLLAVYVEMKS